MNQGLSCNASANMGIDFEVACRQVPPIENKQDLHTLAEYEDLQPISGRHMTHFQNELFVYVPSEYLSKFKQEELEIAEFLGSLAEQQPHYEGTPAVYIQPQHQYSPTKRQYT